MDIGCGPGNTARLLGETFTNATIVGLDIDQQMIEFARAKCARRFRFIVQDIAQSEWEALHEELRQLAGTVDAIFSNYACQWVQDIGALARNAWRLLRPEGGVFCSALCYDGDLAEVADSAEQAALLRQACPYPSERQFIDTFLFQFKAIGFRQFEIDYDEPTTWFAEDFYRNDFANIPLRWYQAYARDLHAWQSVADIVRKLHFRHRIRRTMLDEHGVRRCEISQNLWCFVAQRRPG